jgi:acyl-CoA reductase-like NAD-dependent aldehyde dehydrogenase
VRGFFDDIEKQDQKVAVSGTTPDSVGYFITPIVIDNPREDSRLVVKEPFGIAVQNIWIDAELKLDRSNSSYPPMV